jgi:hypothetical protein
VAARTTCDTTEEASLPKSRRRTVNAEIQSIRRSLSSIGRALARLGPALEAEARGPKPARARGPKRRLSPERRAALVLQGQYIGHVRMLPPRQQAQVRNLRLKKGVRAAIRYAKGLRRS